MPFASVICCRSHCVCVCTSWGRLPTTGLSDDNMCTHDVIEVPPVKWALIDIRASCRLVPNATRPMCCSRSTDRISLNLTNCEVHLRTIVICGCFCTSMERSARNQSCHPPKTMTPRKHCCPSRPRSSVLHLVRRHWSKLPGQFTPVSMRCV